MPCTRTCHVQLDRQPQVVQRGRPRTHERVQAVEHQLELQPVLPADEADEVVQAELRVALEDGPERRAAGLLDVVEEDDRAVGQRATELLGRVGGSRQQQWEQEEGRPHPPVAAAASGVAPGHVVRSELLLASLDRAASTEPPRERDERERVYSAARSR